MRSLSLSSIILLSIINVVIAIRCYSGLKYIVGQDEYQDSGEFITYSSSLYPVL
ncbi:unnamed protein product [Haemonchus placei]|uniref:Secreted protein n=1 Tax=Haemonchus placei TaxID=6290 RepID=A0A0N4WZP0_HAEPC|nr:unnamed protein product [Haemonchus placei]